MTVTDHFHQLTAKKTIRTYPCCLQGSNSTQRSLQQDTHTNTHKNISNILKVIVYKLQSNFNDKSHHISKIVNEHETKTTAFSKNLSESRIKQ